MIGSSSVRAERIFQFTLLLALFSEKSFYSCAKHDKHPDTNKKYGKRKEYAVVQEAICINIPVKQPLYGSKQNAYTRYNNPCHKNFFMHVVNQLWLQLGKAPPILFSRIQTWKILPVGFKDTSPVRFWEESSRPTMWELGGEFVRKISPIYDSLVLPWYDNTPRC